MTETREAGMFGEALITAPPRRSQNGMFNCIPHHTALINKVTALATEGLMRAHERVCVRTGVYACCLLSNKEFSFLRDYSTAAVSQNRKRNKLVSQEEESFMSDALKRKKQAGFHKLDLVGL